MVDISAQTVIDTFVSNWIAIFGIPSTITTDRGSQFSSAIFTQLTKTWGITTVMTTPYHPEANGLVERFHRRLKESLIALGADESDRWFWKLPMSLLAIRTTIKPDLGASPADLVFGEGLSVPGEVLPKVPSTDAQLLRQREAALSDLRVEVARLQPTETSAHRRPLVHLPEDLNNCTHIFVRRGGVQSTLAAPYSGPYRVISRNNVNFRIAIPGRPNEAVAIARIKPAYVSIEEDVEIPSPPPLGRPPRPPRGREPPVSQQHDLRSTRGDLHANFQPPNQMATPPNTRRQRSNASRHDNEDNFRFVNVSPLVSQPTSPQHSPQQLQQPCSSAAAEQQQQDVAPAASETVTEPRRRLFSNPTAKNFSYNRQPNGRPLPTSSMAPSRPEASNRPQNEGKQRFFSSSSASRFSRPRLNLPTVRDAIRRHLGGTTSDDVQQPPQHS